MQTGSAALQKDVFSSKSDDLFYFLHTTGFMVNGKKYTLGGWQREFDSDYTAKPMEGLCRNTSGKYCYFENGAKQYGWQKIDSKSYYFGSEKSSDHGYMFTGNIEIGGVGYKFDENGV